MALPDWFAVTNAEAKRFLRTVRLAAAAASPSKSARLVLYNPGNAKRILAPDDYTELTEELVGLKVRDRRSN